MSENLPSSELSIEAHAERLKQLVDPEFAKLPPDIQLERACKLVMSRRPGLAREWQFEADDLARVGSREKLSAARTRSAE